MVYLCGAGRVEVFKNPEDPPRPTSLEEKHKKKDSGPLTNLTLTPFFNVFIFSFLRHTPPSLILIFFFFFLFHAHLQYPVHLSHFSAFQTTSSFW
jgi:hypothetical protein